MKNSVECPHCKTDNANFSATCSKCNSYLREKVVNLDLWKTIGMLIESPSEAFRNIIYSEHKNFIIFILLFASVKLLIDTRFVSLITVTEFHSTIGLGISYLLLIVPLFILLFLTSIIFKTISGTAGINTRIKDYFAVMCFTIIPFVFGALIIFPFELIIYGDYLFSVNPSPFVIKKYFAYFFLLLEVAIILWSIFLSFKGFKVQTANNILAFVFTIIYNSLLVLLIFISSKIIFTL